MPMFSQTFLSEGKATSLELQSTLSALDGRGVRNEGCYHNFLIVFCSE